MAYFEDYILNFENEMIWKSLNGLKINYISNLKKVVSIMNQNKKINKNFIKKIEKKLKTDPDYKVNNF
jgi:hypothetical protein